LKRYWHQKKPFKLANFDTSLGISWHHCCLPDFLIQAGVAILSSLYRLAALIALIIFRSLSRTISQSILFSAND
jgi:hypothetical protein